MLAWQSSFAEGFGTICLLCAKDIYTSFAIINKRVSFSVFACYANVFHYKLKNHDLNKRHGFKKTKCSNKTTNDEKEHSFWFHWFSACADQSVITIKVPISAQFLFSLFYNDCKCLCSLFIWKYTDLYLHQVIRIPIPQFLRILRFTSTDWDISEKIADVPEGSNFNR